MQSRTELESGIPAPIRTVFFSSVISNNVLSLMQQPLESVSQTISSDQLQNLVPEESDSESAWIAIALSQPGLSDELLLNAATQLHIKDNNLFIIAAAVGKISLMRLMIKDMPVDKIARMVTSGNADLRSYGAFQEASRNGHLDVMKFLMEQVPNNRISWMIDAGDKNGGRYGALRYAARSGHFEVMQYLIETLIQHAPNKLNDMLSEYNFNVLGAAFTNNDSRCITYLLSFSCVFAHADAQLYRKQVVRDFVTSYLSELREKKSAFIPNALVDVFDIEAEQAKLCFYILRHIIKEDNKALVAEYMPFLIDIPGLRALLHTEVTPGQPSELMRLAEAKDNDAAFIILNAIPEVNEAHQRHLMLEHESRFGYNRYGLYGHPPYGSRSDEQRTTSSCNPAYDSDALIYW